MTITFNESSPQRCSPTQPGCAATLPGEWKTTWMRSKSFWFDWLTSRIRWDPAGHAEARGRTESPAPRARPHDTELMRLYALFKVCPTLRVSFIPPPLITLLRRAKDTLRLRCWHAGLKRGYGKTAAFKVTQTKMVLSKGDKMLAAELESKVIPCSCQLLMLYFVCVTQRYALTNTFIHAERVFCIMLILFTS